MKTMTVSLFNIKHVALVIAVAGLLLSSVFTPVHKVQAATTSELLAQIQQLMIIVQGLQSQVLQMQGIESVSSETVLPAHLVGGRMQTLSNLRVRGSASTYGTFIGVQNKYSWGTVIAGPVHRDGYTWWKVSYDSGMTGWSVGEWLRFSETPVAQPVQVSSSDASCSITTDKSLYTQGEDIKVSWTSSNADTIKFSGADSDDLDLPMSAQRSSGSKTVDADEIGVFKIKMEALDENDEKSTCGRTIEIESSQVKLRINGDSVSSHSLDPNENLLYTYHPQGEIESCKITGYFEDGSYSIEHDWDKWVDSWDSGSYGRGSFLAVTTYKEELFGVLEKIVVRCGVSGQSDITDSIRVTINDSGEKQSYQITYNGEDVSSGSNATETDVMAACRAEIATIQYNGYRGQYADDGDTVSCYWGGSLLHEVDGWKG